MATTVYVRGADRMITEAQIAPEGLQVRFADDRSGTIPLRDLKLPRLPHHVEVPNPYVILVHLDGADAVEVPSQGSPHTPWILPEWSRHEVDHGERNGLRQRLSNGAGCRGGDDDLVWIADHRGRSARIASAPRTTSPSM